MDENVDYVNLRKR